MVCLNVPVGFTALELYICSNVACVFASTASCTPTCNLPPYLYSLQYGIFGGGGGGGGYYSFHGPLVSVDYLRTVSHTHTHTHTLQTSCDINAKNDLNRTPLHTAVMEGHSRVVERMVGYGVDLNAVDDEGNSPLHVVLIKKNAKPLSSDTPQMNNVRGDSCMTSNYMYFHFQAMSWLPSKASSIVLHYSFHYLTFTPTP